MYRTISEQGRHPAVYDRTAPRHEAPNRGPAGPPRTCRYFRRLSPLGGSRAGGGGGGRATHPRTGGGVINIHNSRVMMNIQE